MSFPGFPIPGEQPPVQQQQQQQPRQQSPPQLQPLTATGILEMIREQSRQQQAAHQQQQRAQQRASASQDEVGGGFVSLTPSAVSVSGASAAMLDSLNSIGGGGADDDSMGSSSSGGVQFDWTELEAEIQNMEQAEQERFLEQIALTGLQIDGEEDPFAPLPTQNQVSRLLQQAVIDQYKKLRALNEDPKKKFQSAKARRKDLRQRKQALESRSKQKFKLSKQAAKSNRFKNAKY